MGITFLGSNETQIELIYNAKADDIVIGKDISLGFVVDSIEQISEILKKKISHYIQGHSSQILLLSLYIYSTQME